MRQTEERKELVEEINATEKINSSQVQNGQTQNAKTKDKGSSNKNERKKPNKFGLIALLIALVAVIVLAIVLCNDPNACLKGQVHTDANLDLICDNCNKDMPCVEGKKHADADLNLICDNCGVKLPCKNNESHIDANLDLVCDNCKGKIPCANGEVHADVNNDLLCDNCGAGIASSDVSVYKEIENEKETLDEKNVSVRGNMPTDTKVAMNEIERNEAISLAQKYKDIESKDVIAAYDITLTDSENIKYQPANDGEKVKVTISNLNIDPSKGLAMMHIIDENNYEMIGLNRITSTEVEFTTNRFSTYILVTVGTSKIEFEGLGTYTVLDSENVPLASGVEFANLTSFEFKIMPVDNYTLTSVVLKNASGTVINPSLDGSTIFSMSDYGTGKSCKISSITQDLKIEVTNVITLTNPITLTAVTDGEWTNQDITVEIDWPVTAFTNQIKIDDGEWTDYSEATYTMTASGTLYARVFDGDQGGGEVNVPVLNIDKIAPVVTLYQDTTGYTTSSKIYMNATEEGAGIYGYASSVWGYTYCTSYKTVSANTFSLSGVHIGTDNDNYQMCVRVKDLAGNIGQATLDVTNVDKGTPIISDGTTYSDALYNQYKGYGSTISTYSDSMFTNSSGGIGSYQAPSKFSMTRMTYDAAGIEKWSGTSSNYVIKFSSQGKSSYGYLGGWNQSFRAVPGAYYIHRFVAKIPVGYTVDETANSTSTARRWLTSNVGTGDWYEYMYVYDSYETGTFMTVSYNMLYGTPGTEDNPLEWYLAFNTVYDLTHLWDDIDVTYNTDASATLNIKVQDGFSGVKSITVNDVEIPFTEVTAGSNKSVTADYIITEPGTYKIIATDNAGNTATLTKTAYLITYDGNGADGGTTVNQIKIGNVGNARESLYNNEASKNKSILLRQNGYTNSNGLAFQGWSTTTDEIVEYMAGARCFGNTNLDLYAVWNDGIVWDVSKTTSDSVRAKVSEITAGSGKYQLTIYGTGMMKGWSLQEARAGALPWETYRSKIYKVVIEEGVTNLGTETIWGMNNLTSFTEITFPNSLTRLENNCIRECSNLRGTLNISKNIVYVSAMYGVPVTEIVVDANNPTYASKDGALYNKTMTTLIMYPVGSSNKTFAIPDSVTSVGGEAMEHSSVTNITIPTSVKSIGGFGMASNPFTNLYLHAGITTINNGTFYNLYNVDSIYIHAQDITLNENSFTDAKSGSKIYTVSKTVADKFVAGTHYTAANTTIYYPPYFSSHPTSRSAGEGTTTTFTVTAVNGSPTGTLTYQWQYRENASAEWKNVTSAQGTGGTTRSFTTVTLTTDMNGYQFRCKLANGIYPNAEITEDEISSAIISYAATVTVIQANYLYNNQYFETLADAYVEVKRNYSAEVAGSVSATITVNQDCIDASDFNHAYSSNINKLTINTNGKTLTKIGTPIKNSGPMFITGSGTIQSSTDSTKAIATVIENSGTLTINGATIKHNGTTSGTYKAIANVASSSTTTVNSGNVIEEYSLETTGTGNGYAIYSDVASTITINGGTVSSKTNKTGNAAIEAYGTNKTSIYVYGGTVESVTDAVHVTSGASGSTTASLIQAEGGTITGGRYGIFYDTGTTAVLRVNGATVYGGTSGVINYGTGETLLMTGTIDGANAAITTASTAPVSIKGGTIKGSTGILNETVAKVTIYTGTIDSTNYGIHNRSTGEIRIENGTVKGNLYYGVYNEGAGTINVLGGTILSAEARGIRDDGSGTINIGNEDGVISVTTPVVQGETFGVYAETGTVFNFYDGKIKGITAPFVDGTIDSSEDGYSVFRSREGNYIAATLQSGWDISPIGSSTVTAWAVLEQDANDMDKYKLIITGTGAMKDFTTTSVPWLGYRHLIATVDIQEGITNLGDNVMYNFESLTDLTTPSTITSIGDHAFANCKNISGTFEIPAGVTSIGVNPFAYATFENITLADGNISYVVEDRALYNVGKTTLLAYPAGNTSTDFVIPSTVTTVGQEAFATSKLVNITIPTNVTTISNDAFNGSSNVTTLLIPSSVTSIGTNAFANMTSLETLYLKTGKSASIGSGAFLNMASGSTIYTISYDVYTNLSGKYTTANTVVYYPPKITVQPPDQALVCPEPGEFVIEVQDGNPSGITYQWYIKEPDATDWREVTSSDGTGGTTATFTTGYTDPEMVGTTYRCMVKSNTYPNEYFTQDEISADTVSRAASLSISGGNYRVDSGLYYPTFQAALEGAGAGTHDITVIVSTVDDSAPVIASNQVITLDMKSKEIEKLTAGIINNGTLTINNGGTIETISNASAGIIELMINNGTLNLQGSTIRHNGNEEQIAYALQNYGTFNMTSGAVEMKLNSAIATTAKWSARGITNFEGTLNISGGTVAIDYNVSEANLSIAKECLAYAIEGWDADYIGGGTDKTGVINISGTTNITSTGKGIVLKYDAEDYESKHNLKITGGTIIAGEYGIWASQYIAGSIEITGGTITADDTAIKVESTGLVPVSITGATVTSNGGHAVHTTVANSTVTIGAGSTITAASDGIVFGSNGIYTQTGGRITAASDGVTFGGNATINITGGTVIATAGNGLDIPSSATSATATISGATITASQKVINMNAATSLLTIEDGTYRSNGSTGTNEYGIYMNAATSGTIDLGKTNEAGPSITSGYVGVYLNSASGNMRMNSGLIDAKEGITTSDTLSGTITINAGTINGSNKGINTAAPIELLINNATMTSNTCIINLAGNAKASIVAGSYSGLNTGITMAGASTLTMEGGTIDTSIYGITNSGTGTLTIKGGNVYAGEIAVEHNGAAGTLTIGEDDVTEWVSKVNPEIRSIVAIDAPNGFNFYDGILKGIASTNDGEILDIPDKYDLYDGEETIDSKLYKTKFIAMGWDISATVGVDNVWAFLEKTETGRTLTIQGTGAIKDFEYVDDEYSNIPWINYYTEIDKLIIEEGITVIGSRVFAKLYGITTINIPEGVIRINDWAFIKSLQNSKTVSIPSTLTSMGVNPFAYASVSSFKVASGNTYYKVVNDVLFNIDGTELVAYPRMKADTSYTIPESVTKILRQSFREADNLKTLIVGSNVTQIEEGAFIASNQLEKVYINSNKLTTVEQNAFSRIAEGSIIYTNAKSIADLFVADTNYTSANTKVYYPPVINTHPVSQEITNGNPVTFSVGVTAGNPATKYTWQIKSPTSTEWVNATASDGTGYNEASFVVLATGDLDGYQYRCVVSSDGYPNEEMTNAELALTSNAATLTINAANYQVGSLYYNTLKAAVESITTTAETRIEVLLDNTEEDAVIIGSTQNIVIDLNECVITGNDFAIVNKGKLTLTGEGSINAVYKESSYWLFSNRGTINVESGTYKFENKNTEDYITLGIIINENETSVTNIYGGTFEAINENEGFSTCVNAYAGEVNVFGGEINAGHYGIFNSGAFNARINVSGGDITANNSGVLLTKTNSSNTAQETNLNISGTTKIYGAKYGIWNEFSTVDINITGGTIEGGTHGIMNTTSKTIIGTQGGELSATTPEIIGGSYSIESTNGIYFYDGILKGKTKAYYGNITAVETNSHIMLKSPSENGTSYYSAHLEDNDTFVNTWDISKTSGTDNVTAGIKVIAGDGVNSATRYKLVIYGTGETRGYTISTTTTNTPWFTPYAPNTTTLELREGVTSYGNALFANMTAVTSISIPDSVTSFGDYTFARMTSLPNTFEIGKNVTSMGNNPFRDVNLTAFTIETGNTAFAVDSEGVLYTSDLTRLISYPKSKTLARYEVKSNVTNIDAYAFYNASNLNKVFLKVTEANKGGINRTGTFMGLSSGSIIYTEAKEIADLFVAGTTYTGANTIIYYPFKIITMPEDIILNIGESLILEPDIRAGNPTDDVKYQWYFNGGALNGETGTTFRKDLIVDSDSGDYQILIKSALVDGEYYYSHMSEPTNMIVRDHVGPETVSVAITYHEDGTATATVTAHDSYSGVAKFYLNDTELTTGVTIKNDGSGTAVFDITSYGAYNIEVADVEDNRTEVQKSVYQITYNVGTSYQTSGSMLNQLLVHGYPITLRECGFHKTGYTFSNWKTPAGVAYDAGDSYNEAGHALITAVWTINQYTVAFYTDTGDGVKLLAQNTYNYEDTIMVPGQQVHVAEMDGTTKYKIYRHKGDWVASIVGEKGDLDPVDINSSNASTVKVIDANVRYDVVYDITTYDVGNATVYIDGNSKITANTTANDIAIKNDEGLVIIGPKPEIYGPIQNNNGIVTQN